MSAIRITPSVLNENRDWGTPGGENLSEIESNAGVLDAFNVTSPAPTCAKRAFGSPRGLNPGVVTGAGSVVHDGSGIGVFPTRTFTPMPVSLGSEPDQSRSSHVVFGEPESTIAVMKNPGPRYTGEFVPGE
jgi:hypothetical protein